MTNEKLRVIAMLETARTEMIAKGVNGWPNAVLAAIELLSTPPGDDEVERVAKAIFEVQAKRHAEMGIDVPPWNASLESCREDRRQLARAAITAIPSRGEGWIVGDSTGSLWRTWGSGYPEWTVNRDDATRFSRREDAEAVHRDDEEAWLVTPFAAPSVTPGDAV